VDVAAWTLAGRCWACREEEQPLLLVGSALETRAAARWELLMLLLVPLLAPRPKGMRTGSRRRQWPYKVKEEWREEQWNHAPYHYRMVLWEGRVNLKPEFKWNGWEWEANDEAPTAEELEAPDVLQSQNHPEVVAAKAAAQRGQAEMREMCDDDGEYERELMYESAGLAVFLRSRYDSDD
tara:strand:- start:51 stop:590 length:540 start_codon:yes stop_codon:yes gene_type:complete